MAVLYFCMSWTPATSIEPRAAHLSRMRILSKHRESTGLSRSHLEGSDPVGKDSPRFAHLFSCRSTPFFSTFAHRLRAERGDARAHSRKRKWALSAQFWCNLSPLDATLLENRGWGTHPNIRMKMPILGERGESKNLSANGGKGFLISLFPYLLTSLPLPLMIASATSPARPSDAPSARPSAATRSGWPLARNTISPDGPHHQSASTAGCASIPPPAGSSSPDPGGEKSCRRSGKSKPAGRTNSKLPRNRSGTNPDAPASLLRGWKTTSSRFDRSLCGYSAAQNRS